MKDTQSSGSLSGSEENFMALAPLSRRAFFSLTAVVGSLTFLGISSNGRILAYADEADNVSFVVYILSKDQVPFMAFDVTGGQLTPLEGVEITVTSLLDEIASDKKTQTFTTNADGFYPLHVMDMSYQHGNDKCNRYNFWGAVSAKKDTYREFAVEHYYIEAGTPSYTDPDTGYSFRPNVVCIATQKINNDIYLRQLTLDGADIQYSYDVEAKVWSANDIDHPLVAELIAPTAGASITLDVLLNGSKVVSETKTTGTTAPYSATFTFNRPWLKDTPLGATLSFSWTSGGRTWGFVSPLVFAAPVLPDSTASAYSDDVALSPGVGDINSDEGKEAARKRVRSIDGFLGRVGDTLNCAMPAFPLQVFFDSYGRFGASVTLARLDFLKTHNGVDKMDGKKLLFSYPGKDFCKALDGYAASLQECFDNFDSVFDGDGLIKGYGAAKPMTDMNMNLMIELLALGNMDEEKSGKGDDDIVFYGDIAIKPSFSASASYTRQLQAGMIPLFVTFDLSLRLSCEMAFGMEFVRRLHKISSHFHTGKEGRNIKAIILFRFEVGATVGVGIAGICSAGVRGFGYLHEEFTFGPVEDGKDFPHTVVKLGVDFQAVLQFLFVKKTIALSRFKPIVGYDSWKSNDAAALQAGEDAEDYELPCFDFDEDDLVLDSDMAGQDNESIETYAEWAVANGEDGASAPTYGAIESSVSDTNEIFTNPAVASPYVGAEYYDSTVGEYNPINGVKPSKIVELYKTCYSNPRIRIVHTDTSSFDNDRAFMLRVVTVGDKVPQTTALFASVYAEAQATNAAPVFHQLVIKEDAYGNKYVEEADEVDSNAVANGVQDTVLPRTRVAVCEWDKSRGTWEPAHVIDFCADGETTEVDRLNSYDIDFDVDYHDGSLYVAITSIFRPNGKKVDLLEMESKQYISLVRYDIGAKQVVAGGSTLKQKGALSLFHPHIVVQNFDEGDGKPTKHCVIYSYAVQYASDLGSREKAYLAATIFDNLQTASFSGHAFCPPTIISCEELEKLDVDVLVEGSFEVSCPDPTKTIKSDQSGRYNSTVLVAWQHPKSKNYKKNVSMVFLQSFAVTKAASNSAEANSVYKSYVTKHAYQNLQGVPGVVKMGSAKQQAVFSYPLTTIAASGNEDTSPRPLQLITVDLDNMALGTKDSVGSTDKLTYFSSFNGRRLYCVRAIDTENLVHDSAKKADVPYLNFGRPGLDETTVEAYNNGCTPFTSDGTYNTPFAAGDLTTATKPVKMYQLLEARWVPELNAYYEFYPIAQLDRIPDNIGVIAASHEYTHFTFASLNKGYDTVDVFQVDVKVVMAADLSNGQPISPFAAPGDTCFYSCDIANFGTAPITSITMKVTRNGKEFAGSEQTFADLSQYMLPAVEDAVVSATNDDSAEIFETLAAEESPDQVTMAGILWPGKKRRFLFNFTVPEIPDSERGQETQFEIAITKVEDHTDLKLAAATAGTLSTMATSSTLPLFADDDYVLPESTDSGEDDTDWLQILDTATETIKFDSTAQLTASDIGLQVANYTTDDSSDKKKAPATGDGLGIGALGAVALGAAALGVAAYEKRRADNAAANTESE